MEAREVNAKEALKDIIDGMSEHNLMEKYRLTPRGLKRLYQSLEEAGLLAREGARFVSPPKKRIITAQIVNDILSGLTDQELRDRYRLSHLELTLTFKLLVERGFITQTEIDGRTANPGGEAKRFTPRQAPRHKSPIAVAAIAGENREREGLVLDLSEKGVAVIGIDVEEGDSEKITVLGDEFGDVAPFQFDAVCRWVRKESGGEPIAGFEIVHIEQESLEEMRNWIRVCTIGLDFPSTDPSD